MIHKLKSSRCGGGQWDNDYELSIVDALARQATDSVASRRFDAHCGDI